jgi:hypothetical protein
MITGAKPFGLDSNKQTKKTWKKKIKKQTQNRRYAEITKQGESNTLLFAPKWLEAV